MAADRARMEARQRWVLGLVSVASFIFSLDVLVVATALTTIQQDLSASIETLEWTVSAYNLSFAVLLLTGAALGDRFGRRRMFVAGLALFTLSSAACALSPGIGTLIASRTIQGVGSALMMPLALTLLSSSFPPEMRGKALGFFSGITGLATFSGPVIGGAIAEGFTWQWIFWINIPIGVVVILLTVRHIQESYGPNTRFDLVGVVLASGSAFGLVWALVRGNGAGWSSGEVLWALAGGFLLAIAFVVWETRTSAPMLPMRFFRLRAFTTANVANFCLYASLFGTLFLLAQYLQVALGNGPLDAGLRLMPWTATLMICAPLAGNLADKMGERRFMVSGLLLQAIGMAWLALIARPDLPYANMLLPLIISGCGVSAAMPAAQKSVVGAVQPQEIGQASGAITMLRILGGVFGITILGAVFAGLGGLGSPQSFTDGFAPAIGVASGLALIGAMVGLGIPGRRTIVPARQATPSPSRAW